MTGALDLSRFTDGGLEAARFSLSGCAALKTCPDHLCLELREMARLLETELQDRKISKPNTGWKPRVICNDAGDTQ